METTIFQLKKEVEEILTTNILPYWMDKMTDVQHGGFYGRINGQEVLMPEAEKGAILNARILWTFSSAYRLLHKPEYLKPPPVPNAKSSTGSTTRSLEESIGASVPKAVR